MGIALPPDSHIVEGANPTPRYFAFGVRSIFSNTCPSVCKICCRRSCLIEFFWCHFPETWLKSFHCQVFQLRASRVVKNWCTYSVAARAFCQGGASCLLAAPPLPSEMCPQCGSTISATRPIQFCSRWYAPVPVLVVPDPHRSFLPKITHDTRHWDIDSHNPTSRSSQSHSLI